MTTWIGIDPGLLGSIAVIHENGSLTVVDTPTVLLKKGSAKREYLPIEMYRLLPLEGCAALEHGIAFGSQSSSATYQTGRGAGLWEMALAAAGIPFENPLPLKWKRALGLPPGADKDASRMMAQRMFPAYAPLFARVKDDGRAEAALLAIYAQRTWAK
jgi:crossover junction endodeoxyribonuclease RuvC